MFGDNFIPKPYMAGSGLIEQYTRAFISDLISMKKKCHQFNILRHIQQYLSTCHIKGEEGRAS